MGMGTGSFAAEQFLSDNAERLKRQTMPPPLLTDDAAARKGIPICEGVFDYFPRALAAVAVVSRIGNDQHNPGQPLHWDKSKSTDHANCIARHLLERGTIDKDGARHSAKLAWRALALLETELEREAQSPPQQ